MRATSAFVRLFIRGLSWDAEELGASFLDALKSAARGKLKDSAKGKVLVGTATSGTSVTYTLPPLGTLTAEDIAEICAVLLDKVDAIKADEPSITDTDLIAALLEEFPSIRSVGVDFRGLRL